MDRSPQLFALDLARSDKHISRASMKCFSLLFIIQLVSQDCPEVGRAVYLSGPRAEQNHFLHFLIKYLILQVHIFLFQCCLTTAVQAL